MDWTSLPNFADPHVHVKSFDAASTAEKFAQRELELGGKFLTVTDHGTMEGIRDLYTLTTKSKKYAGKLHLIPGLEAYFRDDDCDLMLAAGAQKNKDGKLVDWIKYLHLTMHFQDQAAFETCSRLLSRADLRAETHGSERKPLFTWKDLEELGAQNVTFGSSCLIGMVSRHLLAQNDHTTALKYYERLRALVKPGNFVVELFPHRCGSNWVEGVFLKFADGTQIKYYEGKNLRTAAGEIKAKELADSWKRNREQARETHQRLLAVKHYNTWTDEAEPRELLSVEHIQGEVANECRPWCPDGDVQLGVNRFMLEQAERHGDPVIISTDSHFAYPEEKVVQDVRLGQGWQFVNSHHKLGNVDAWAYCSQVLGTSEAQFQRYLEASWAWAEGFKGFKLTTKEPLPTRFYPKETLRHLGELIIKHDKMDWKNPVYMERLREEIDLLHHNGTIDLLPYLFVCEDAIMAHLRAGILPGPGRGSAAGLLLADLLDITQVDPIYFGLSKDRFLTADRIKTGKMPDVDMDFPTRDFLIDPQDSEKGWLKERFGDCVAQLSADTTIKLKSAILDTFRRLNNGSIPPEVASFAHNLPDPPQGVESRSVVFGYDDNGTWVPGLYETMPELQEFAARYPQAWGIITLLLGLYRQKTRHASGFIISNEPVENFIPLVTVGGVRATQFTAAAVEASGALKFDFLAVHAVGDVHRALGFIRARHGLPSDPKVRDGVEYVWARSHDQEGGSRERWLPVVMTVPWRDQVLDIYHLPTDQGVYEDIVKARTASVFQLHTEGASDWMRQFDFVKPDGRLGLNSIEDLAAFTALDRPGGLKSFVTDAKGKSWCTMVEYARRAKGKEPVGALPILLELIPRNYGIMCFQEDLQRVFQVIGGVSGVDANNFRADVSKKLREKVIAWKTKFMPGAVERLGAVDAEILWEQMVAWADYGFNKSHAVSYMKTGYATAWLKHHYPLEWWCSVLQGAKREKIFSKFWPHCGDLIDFPDIRYGNKEFEIVGDRIRAPLELLKGIGEAAGAELEIIQRAGPIEDVKEFCTRVQDRRIALGTPGVKKDKKGNEFQTIKKARTALHSGVVGSLILGGAMDSIFPAGLNPAEKLKLWEQEWKALGNTLKKKDHKLITPLRQYQLRKDVLPGFAANIGAMAWEALGADGQTVETDRGAVQYIEWQLPDSEQTSTWEMSTWEDVAVHLRDGREGGHRMAFAAYVLEERRFEYLHKDLNRKVTAVELILEIETEAVKLVRWPKRDGTLPPAFRDSLQGAVVMALCEFTGKKGKPVAILDARVLERPIGDDDKEESAD